MKKISFIIFKIVRWLVWVFYPKTRVLGTENLPDSPSIIVGNHTQMNGPIIGEIYYPRKSETWCAGQMMNLKEVPAYAYKDFWSKKPKVLRPFYKLLSYIIAPLSVAVFNNAKTIAVYHDSKIVATFKNTVKALDSGNDVIIFPEHYALHNHIVNDFQDRFIDIAKLYYKKTGKELTFVPMYIAPTLKEVHLGKPIKFSPDTPLDEERKKICDYLMDEITKIAVNLPRHKVVPYPNTPKSKYKYNKED